MLKKKPLGIYINNIREREVKFFSLFEDCPAEIKNSH
jgi:hypothetical protein